MKRKTIGMIIALLITMTPINVYASSLDEIVDSNSEIVSEIQDNSSDTSLENNDSSISEDEINNEEYRYVDTQTWIKSMRDATDYTQNNEVSNKVNESVKKVASIIVQILSYAVTALLAVRVMLDLLYIAIPFTRSILANGYAGNAQAGGGMNMMNGGMGQPGMGMNSINNMRMGMSMQQNTMMMQGQNQMGASPSLGRVQWISNAALNAVSAEGVTGADGRANSALKIYSKDMMIILVLTPILIILAVSGALTNFGFLVGNGIAKILTSIGGLI